MHVSCTNYWNFSISRQNSCFKVHVPRIEVHFAEHEISNGSVNSISFWFSCLCSFWPVCKSWVLLWEWTTKHENKPLRYYQTLKWQIEKSSALHSGIGWLHVSSFLQGDIKHLWSIFWCSQSSTTSGNTTLEINKRERISQAIMIHLSENIVFWFYLIHYSLEFLQHRFFQWGFTANLSIYSAFFSWDHAIYHRCLQLTLPWLINHINVLSIMIILNQFSLLKHISIKALFNMLAKLLISGRISD